MKSRLFLIPLFFLSLLLRAEDAIAQDSNSTIDQYLEGLDNDMFASSSPLPDYSLKEVLDRYQILSQQNFKDVWLNCKKKNCPLLTPFKKARTIFLAYNYSDEALEDRQRVYEDFLFNRIKFLKSKGLDLRATSKHTYGKLINFMNIHYASTVNHIDEEMESEVFSEVGSDLVYSQKSSINALLRNGIKLDDPIDSKRPQKSLTFFETLLSNCVSSMQPNDFSHFEYLIRLVPINDIRLYGYNLFSLLIHNDSFTNLDWLYASIEAGLDPNIKCTRCSGSTPLMLLSKADGRFATDQIIKRRSNSSGRLMAGTLFLHREDFNSVAQLLIEKGGDINIQDEFGNTPLHWAVIFHNESIARVLLNNKADLTIENMDGLTARDLLESYLARGEELVGKKKYNYRFKDSPEYMDLKYIEEVMDYYVRQKKN